MPYRALAILLRGLLIAGLLAAGPGLTFGQVDAGAACAAPAKLVSCAVTAGTRESAGELAALLVDRKSDPIDAATLGATTSSVASVTGAPTTPRNAVLAANGHHCRSLANPPTGPPSRG